MARTCLTVILAAGEGTRMHSALPKVLHRVGGLAMVCHVVNAAKAAKCNEFAVVVGRDSEKVEAEVGALAITATFHEQSQRLGTAHAVLAARKTIARGYDDILVLFGDTPLLNAAALTEMRKSLADGADVAALGFHAANPHGYGRLVIARGQLTAIREEKDASAKQRKINFCNAGIMAINGRKALEMLDAIGNSNAKGEYYLTDIVEIARKRGLKVVARQGAEDDMQGINNRAELAKVEALWQQRRRKEIMLAGVTLLAPDTVYFSHDTQIGEDCLIEPNVFFGPGVRLGSSVVVKAFCHLAQTSIADNCQIGPFARMRGNVELDQNVRIGNFVELKNAKFATGAKAAHLSYLGDATIGAKANIGAGTITCNYDGFNKHLTQIGEAAFIGSNSSLVAPVSIGKGAYVASGSVIVEDVPAGALGVARGRQVNKPGHAAKIRQKAISAKTRSKG